jgi:hypothetical protein
MTLQEIKEIYENATLGELLDEWDLAQGNYPGEVIGALLEELERRNPAAFKMWLEQDLHERELKEFMTVG